MRLAERSLDVAGLWGWLALAALFLCIQATALAFGMREVRRPAAFAASVMGLSAALVWAVPIAAARRVILSFGVTREMAGAAAEARNHHLWLLLGGGFLAAAALALAAVAILRRGEVGTSVTLLVVVPSLIPAGLSLRMAWPLVVGGVGALQSSRTFFEEAHPTIAPAAMVITLLIGAALIAARARSNGMPLGTPGRFLAAILALVGPLAFIATRSMAVDARHPLPAGDRVAGGWVSLEHVPLVEHCTPRDDEAALLTMADDAEGMILDGALVEPVALAEDMAILTRNWDILYPLSDSPPRLTIVVRTDSDPRTMGDHLRALRDAGFGQVFLRVRRRWTTDTQTLGPMQQYTSCAIPFTLAAPGTDEHDVVQLSRVTDVGMLARVITDGVTRLGL